MNQQQKAEQTAYELLTELGADLHTTTPLQLCTAAVLRGVVIGLRDANQVATKFLRARERIQNAQNCADCNALLPGPYGTAGVAMARTRPSVLLCSSCGTAEALANAGLPMGFGRPDITKRGRS
jgi:hypothetical protein